MSGFNSHATRFEPTTSGSEGCLLTTCTSGGMMAQPRSTICPNALTSCLTSACACHAPSFQAPVCRHSSPHMPALPRASTLTTYKFGTQLRQPYINSATTAPLATRDRAWKHNFSERVKLRGRFGLKRNKQHLTTHTVQRMTRISHKKWNKNTNMHHASIGIVRHSQHISHSVHRNAHDVHQSQRSAPCPGLCPSRPTDRS